MKKISLFCMSFFLLISFALPISSSADSEVNFINDCKAYALVKADSLSQTDINFWDFEQQIARSGCCSHHGGVCGCSGGRVVCCDGIYSPSCTCNRDSDIEIMGYKNNTK